MRTKPRLLGNAGCEFCATFRFEEMCVQNRCDTYNRKDKVKKAKARIGVIILAYITDNHKRVYTKDTRTFQKIRFCPVCGFDYIEGRPYDGRKYKIGVNEKQ